ncbi:MAG: phenylacetate--CoA ligase [Methanobrevibacter sp.]|jgi:phenylacetate-CoA ligase|nr:phenylacetate--CoA ligase [Candidatus Methanoflexus mossambicus]
MIYNEKYESMDLNEKKELQLRRLKKMVKTVYEKVPFYKKKFDAAGFKPEDLETLKDIEKIPFTTKTDLREAYPFGMFAVDEDEIIEIHSTSGTTGKPTVAGYTKKDIKIWGEIIARGIVMAGGTKKDIIQNAYGYGLFTGGMGIHHGGYKLGANVVPMSAGNTKRQLEIMVDFQSTILSCTPSYAMYLAESIEKAGIKKSDLALKSGIFGAEMWTEEMRDKIEDKLGITALNIYGLTELTGPGVAMECMAKSGLHISDDHFYPEIIDPKTKKPLDDGQEGELVLTTLTKEGMPIIRFRTKDLTSINHEKCECGRTTARISRLNGRTDDMIKIRGVIVFPSQIEAALLKIDGLTPNYQIIVSRPESLDEVEILVEATATLFSDEMKKMEEIENKIANEIKKEIGLRVKIRIVESESIPRSEGKAVRVIDNRHLTK